MEEDMPDFIKFDFAVDNMVEYCENQCDKTKCIFGYDNCTL